MAGVTGLPAYAGNDMNERKTVGVRGKQEYISGI
jgi:hypothetical protein